MQKMRRTGKRAALPAMAALAAATENETIGCVMAVTSFHDCRGILSGLQRRAQQRGFGALREAAIGAGQLLQSRREKLRHALGFGLRTATAAGQARQVTAGEGADAHED